MINCRVDIVLGIVSLLRWLLPNLKSWARKCFDRERIVLVPDHFAPNKDIKSAQQCKIMREFARSKGIKYYFEVGQMGIEHCLLPEQGLVLPGDVIIGADSHTCTYGALGAFATGVGSTDMAAAMATGEAWFGAETIKFVYYGKLPEWVGGKDLILHTIGILVLTERYVAWNSVVRLFPHCRWTIALPWPIWLLKREKWHYRPDETTLAYIADRAKGLTASINPMMMQIIMR